MPEYRQNPCDDTQYYSSTNSEPERSNQRASTTVEVEINAPRTFRRCRNTCDMGTKHDDKSCHESVSRARAKPGRDSTGECSSNTDRNTEYECADRSNLKC